MTPSRVLFGHKQVLPIKLYIPTWQVLPWHTVRSTGDLLALRARQLERRNEDLREAVDRVRRHRLGNKEYFDDTKRVRTDELEAGDMVLLYDSQRAQDMSRSTKLLSRWLGPYRIRAAHADKGWYMLKELDSIPFRNQTPGNRLR